MTTVLRIRVCGSILAAGPLSNRGAFLLPGVVCNRSQAPTVSESNNISTETDRGFALDLGIGKEWWMEEFLGAGLQRWLFLPLDPRTQLVREQVGERPCQLIFRHL